MDFFGKKLTVFHPTVYEPKLHIFYVQTFLPSLLNVFSKITLNLSEEIQVKVSFLPPTYRGTIFLSLLNFICSTCEHGSRVNNFKMEEKSFTFSMKCLLSIILSFTKN